MSSSAPPAGHRLAADSPRPRAFLERATELTPDPGRRARARAGCRAGQAPGRRVRSALDLLATAEAGPLDELQRARIDLLRAQIAFASSHGSEAPPLLLAAARRLEPLDVGLARETYLDAFSAAMFAGRLGERPRPAGGGAEPHGAAPRSRRRRESDLLLDGLAVLFTDGYVAAMPMSRRALRAFCSEGISGEEGLRWLLLASAIAADLWDDESWYVLSTRQVRIAREAGALGELSLALNSRAVRPPVRGRACGGRGAGRGDRGGERGDREQASLHTMPWDLRRGGATKAMPKRPSPPAWTRSWPAARGPG